MSITEYCTKLKSLTDAFGHIDEKISDCTLVANETFSIYHSFVPHNPSLAFFKLVPYFSHMSRAPPTQSLPLLPLPSSPTPQIPTTLRAACLTAATVASAVMVATLEAGAAMVAIEAMAAKAVVTVAARRVHGRPSTTHGPTLCRCGSGRLLLAFFANGLPM